MEHILSAKMQYINIYVELVFGNQFFLSKVINCICFSKC